jgi:hypothetical protein
MHQPALLTLLALLLVDPAAERLLAADICLSLLLLLPTLSINSRPAPQVLCLCKQGAQVQSSLDDAAAAAYAAFAT